MDALKWIIMLSAMSAIAGCKTITTIHDYCQIAQPIYLQKGESLNISDISARQILEHNKTWAKLCLK